MSFDVIHSAVQNYAFKLIDGAFKECEQYLQEPVKAKVEEVLNTYKARTKAAAKAARGGKRSKRTVHSVANPSAPKRSLSKYNLFFQEKMRTLARANPHGDKSEMMRTVAHLWNLEKAKNPASGAR
jgi:arginine utilization protein RocB